MADFSTLPLEDAGRPPSRTERLAEFFRAHPNQWHDGCGVIAEIGGRYAWRSRLAEARTQLGLDIRNRQRRVHRADGTPYVISEYRFEPKAVRVPESSAPTLFPGGV